MEIVFCMKEHCDMKVQFYHIYINEFPMGLWVQVMEWVSEWLLFNASYIIVKIIV
jgi:hypothetical protein